MHAPATTDREADVGGVGHEVLDAEEYSNVGALAPDAPGAKLNPLGIGVFGCEAACFLRSCTSSSYSGFMSPGGRWTPLLAVDAAAASPE